MRNPIGDSTAALIVIRTTEEKRWVTTAGGFPGCASKPACSAIPAITSSTAPRAFTPSPTARESRPGMPDKRASSAPRYWGEGTFADYGRDHCRRTIEIIERDF